MILLRCRRFGQDEWTEINLDGPDEHYIIPAVGASFANGQLHAQIHQDGEWVDISEMEADDMLEPE